MSTFVYLRCEDHDPALTSDGESGQHLHDLEQIRADIANRDAVVAAWHDDLTSQDHFRRNTARFLAEHPKCQIGIVDEYRRTHPLAEKPDEPLGLGAVVVDSDMVEYVHLGSGLWVYGTTDGPSSGYNYAEIDAVEVLSSGVTA